MKELLEAIEILQNLVFGSPEIDELGSKPKSFETGEADNFKRSLDPHHLAFERACSKKCPPFCLLLAIQRSRYCKIPQKRKLSMFVRMVFRFNYQLIWNPLDESGFKNMPNHFTDQEYISLLIKDRCFHLR